MAVRFLIAFILVSCGASAQVFQTNNVPYKFRGLKADSMLVVPSGADTSNLANPKWGENMNGALFAKTGDSTLWMKVGTRWVKVSSTATTIDTTSLSNRINLKVDSITSSNDSLYYYVNGSRYYVSSFTGFDTAVVVKAQVHNAESTTLLAGEVVYGFSSTGNLLSVKRANNKLESTSSKTFGIVRKDIPAGGIGWIVTNGVVDKLNLGAYTAGQEVYLDSIAGKFTATKPLAPYNMVFVGIVERANAGNGQLYVKIQNGFELYELHNVSARFPSNNQVLKFRASDSLWTPQTDTGITSLTAGVGLTGGTITTTGTIAADTNVLSTRAWRQKGLDSLAALELSLNDTAAMLLPYLRKSDTATMLTNYPRGSGAANQVTFWNGTRSLSGSNNFTFNNRRVGIGTSSPVAQLNIQQPTIDSNLTAINVSGYNLTGSNAQSAVDISGTWNTTGTPTLIKANITNTASNANSRLLDIQSNGVSTFIVNTNGTTLLNNTNNARVRFQNSVDQLNINFTSNNSGWGLITAGGIRHYINNAEAARLDGNGAFVVGKNSDAAASAIVELTSTTRGFLPPRMTAAQRTGIANAAGLLVWDSDSARYMVNNGSAWRGLMYTGQTGPAAGNATEVQFNAGGNLAASAKLKFDSANGILEIRAPYATSTSPQLRIFSGTETSPRISMWANPALSGGEIRTASGVISIPNGTFSKTLESENSSFYVGSFNYGTASRYLLGSSKTYYTSAFANSTALNANAAGAGSSATVLIGSVTHQTTATTNISSSLAIKPVTVTASTTTNNSTLYIEKAGINATNNYSIFVDSGAVRLDGALHTGVRSITGAVTANDEDYTIFADATSGAFNVTMPTAVGITGRIYVIKKTDSSANAVTVNTTSSQTIDGSTTYSLASQYKYVTIQSNGSNWFIISNN